jgi:hypothetical protein
VAGIPNSSFLIPNSNWYGRHPAPHAFPDEPYVYRFNFLVYTPVIPSTPEWSSGMDFSNDTPWISYQACCLSLMLMSIAMMVSAEEPAPNPTPRPGTLGAYARSITLKRSTLEDEAGRLVLTNDGVAALGAGAAITLAAVPTSKGDGLKKTDGASSAERSKWRATHKKQQRVIVGLERRRSLLEVEIESLENQRLTIKTMARLQAAEERIQLLDREIAAERAELARIVREARRHGAEPGWFR